MQKTRLIRLPFSQGRINARIILALLLLLFMLSCAFGHFVSKPLSNMCWLLLPSESLKRSQATRPNHPDRNSNQSYWHAIGKHDLMAQTMGKQKLQGSQLAREETGTAGERAESLALPSLTSAAAPPKWSEPCPTHVRIPG